jgi:hypothetical protein
VQLVFRISTLLLLVVAVFAGCDDGPRATSGTSPATSPTASPMTSPMTSPAVQPDTGARATGGVFESPDTQPASR